VVADRALAVVALVLALAGCTSRAGSTRLDYDRLGLHEQIVTGGQAQIDEGYVVRIASLPGVWLAGHRTSHGAVFARLVEFRVGDRVCAFEQCYAVTGSKIVSRLRLPGYVAPLVLQTSLSADVELLVTAQPEGVMP